MARVFLIEKQVRINYHFLGTKHNNNISTLRNLVLQQSHYALSNFRTIVGSLFGDLGIMKGDPFVVRAVVDQILT